MRIIETLTMAAILSATLPAQETKKATPPPPAAPRPYEFPKAASKTLGNGLRVFVVEDHRLPLVSASVQILAGNAYQTPEKSGLAVMTANLLREGTATRTSPQISKLVDDAGGSLAASAGDDTVTVTMSFMKSYAGLGMDLLSDVIHNPAFSQEELDRQMRQAQSNLAMSYSNAEYLAPIAAARAILGTHPYAYPGDGTPATLRNIKREDIVAFYKANYAPGRAWMAIAGDVTPEEGFAMAEKYLGSWKAEAAADTKLPAPPAPKPQVLIIDMPTAVQTQIVVGQLGVPRNYPDYIALQMGNQIFGGSFNSRINMKLRANEGLTYGASSQFEPNRQAGLFEATTFTRTEKTAEAIRMLADLLNEFKANPATEAEFAEAKAYMIGSFGIATETAGAVAGRVLTGAVHGLPADYWATYRDKVQALTREQMSAAVRRFIQPDKMAIIAVGNAKEFAKQLEAFGPARVIKSDEVDFVAANLEKPVEKTIATPEAAAKATALVNAAVAASGGKEKLLAVKDQTLTGKLKLTMGQGSFDADAVEEVLYPDRYKMVMKLPMGVITQSLDGQSGWMSQGEMSRDLPPNLTEELAKSVPTAGGGLGLLVSVVSGKAEVQSVADDTVLWKSGQFEVKITFDNDSHLPVKLAYRAMGMSGMAEMESRFSDYRDVGGLKLPFKEIILQDGQQVGDRTLSERKVNTGLSEASFKKK